MDVSSRMAQSLRFKISCAGNGVITVRLTGTLEQSIAFFEEDPFVSNLERTDLEDGITFSYKGSAEDQVNLLKRAILNEVPILSFMEHVTDLEDVFMEITKGAD